MQKTFKWHLFFTSFIPLWISIIFIDIWNISSWFICKANYRDSFKDIVSSFLKSNYLVIITLFLISILLCISVITLNIFIKKQKEKTNKPKCKIVEAKHSSNLTADFVLSYILPMIAFDFTAIIDVCLFIIYFFVLAFICIRNNNVYINFYFELRKYKMYNCKLECTRANSKVSYDDCLVISKSDLTSEIAKDKDYWDFENKIYIDITEEM